MRTLSGALVAAVGASAVQPAIKVELIDWVPHYGPIATGGPAGRSSACLAPDGSVVQAYSAGGVVFARRVADPSASSWGAWTTVAGGGAALGTCCVFVGSADVRVIWQNGATTEIEQATSADNGATWGAAVALFDAGGAASGLAADRDGGNLIFVQYAFAANTYRIKAWTKGAGWTGVDWGQPDAFLGVGVGCFNISGTTYYLVCYAVQASSGGAQSVWAGFYNAGVWSGLSAVVPEDLAAGRSLQEPRVASYDGLYHLAFSLVDAGAVTGLFYNRAALAHSLDGIHWTEPLEDAGAYAYGASPLKHAAAGYLLAGADASALAPLYTASAQQYRDCTADCTAVHVREREGQPAELTVELDNGAGAYTSLAALRPNARLRLSLGYAGAGVVYTHVGYVSEWTFERAAALNLVVVRASGATSFLARQSRLALVYGAQTLEYLVREVLARCGLLAVTVPVTTQFSAVVGGFAIPGGETWAHALERLAGLYGFSFGARALSDGTDSCLVVEKGPADPSVWTYGGELDGFHLTRSGDRVNHLLVYGSAGSVLAEAFDFADVGSVGQERFLHVVEPLASTGAQLALRAQLELQAEQRRALAGRLAVALHPGLELFDVVTVVDGPVGTWSGRVVGLEHTFEPHGGSYALVVDLEGV